MSRWSGDLLSVDVVGGSYGYVDEYEEQSEDLTLSIEAKFHLSGACWSLEAAAKRGDLRRLVSRRENEVNENCSDLVYKDNAYCPHFTFIETEMHFAHYKFYITKMNFPHFTFIRTKMNLFAKD